MTRSLKILALAAAVASLAACNQQPSAPATQAAPEAAAPAVLTPPTSNDDIAWKEYLKAVIKQNLQGVRRSPFTYYLPAATAPDFEEQYQRQLDNVGGAIGGGILPGTMLAFASPEAGRMADLIVAAFEGVPSGSMKGVKVLFVGKPEDEARVAAAVQPTNATFIFVKIQ